MKYTYDYPHPSVTADCIVFRFNAKKSEVEVLLVQRKAEPFKGCWAFPGGFVNENEDLVDAAARELKEETTLTGIKFTPLPAVGTPKRDPRGHVITCPFVGVTKSKKQLEAKDDAKALKWWSINNLPKLAFDHSAILLSAFLSVDARLITSMIPKKKGEFYDIKAQRSFSLAYIKYSKAIK